jgi:hypothetical protein
MSVIVLSQRDTVGGLAQQLAYSAWNEAENIAASVAGARLGLVDRHGNSGPVRARRIAGRAVRRIGGRSILLPALGSGLVDRIEPADHLVLMAFGAWDLPLVERMRELRSRARTISVWMPEVWPSELDQRIFFEAYAMVDHVFLGIREVLDDFASIAPNANIECVPPAADVMAFAPPGADGERGIAVLGVGRRDPVQHEQLLAWSDSTGRLYLYDTVRGEAESVTEHRRNLAGWYRRARVSICNYGKHDRPDEIGDLRIVPGRLFEGLAAGAVLVGRPPSEDNQREIVGDVVVHSTETEDLIGLVDRYSRPGADRDERARNMALAARSHDWAHRWHLMYSAVGEPVPEALSARIEALSARADSLIPAH